MALWKCPSCEQTTDRVESVGFCNGELEFAGGCGCVAPSRFWTFAAPEGQYKCSQPRCCGTRPADYSQASADILAMNPPEGLCDACLSGWVGF